MTRLEKNRKNKGYTQRFMADKIGVSVACYNMYENNQRKIPISKAKVIANVLECNIDAIFVPSNFTNCEILVKEMNKKRKERK